MDWMIVLSIGIALLFVLFFLGVPIFIAFLIVNITGTLYAFGPAGFGLFVNSIYNTATFTELATIPLFVLIGEILFRSGSMNVLLNSLDCLIGKVRGRQYVLCIALSGVLGALCGSAAAVAAMLGRSMLPNMLNRGCDTKLSLGTILGGASLAPVIPPSILAIIIGTLANVSIADLLVAGILPGLMLSLLFVCYVGARLWLDPSLAPEEDAGPNHVTWRDRGMAILRMAPCSLVFVLLMGLIMLGMATPSEAAATGAVGALLAAALYKGLSWNVITESLRSAATVSAMILLIMAASVMFSQLLAFTGTAGDLTRFVTGLTSNTVLTLFIMLFIPFILFMFLDEVAVLLILVPIYQPIIVHYDFDPVWFWMLMLINSTLGAMTPPVGYMLFALKGAAPEISTGTIFRAAWPFVGMIVFGLAIMALFPQIITVVPQMIAR